MEKFKELGLAEPLLRALREAEYETPTPIQGKAIPVLMEGRDVVGIAQTGTGKTAAYVLPILDAISRDRVRPNRNRCRSLIIAPTRELAVQISDSVRALAQHMHISVTVVMGGVKAGPQIKGLARGVDVLVATPGRLMDHMNTGAVVLNETEVVVLDEADQMLDMGFIPAIRKIMSKLPAERQTSLFSATMPKPIRALASDFLSAPVEIAVAQQAKPIEKIRQEVIPCTAGEKREMLVDLIEERDVQRAIIFARTKHGADKICRHLETAGLKVEAIHGNKSQAQRQKTLRAFREDKISLLVATDIAARGIDIDNVDHVFNFELPNVPESYVHRIGRTARAGREGVAISLMAPDERGLMRDIERLIDRDFGLPGGRQDRKPAGRKPGGGRPGARKPRNGGGQGGPGQRDGRRDGPRDGQRDGQRDGPRDGQRDGQRDHKGAGGPGGSGKPRRHKPGGNKQGAGKPGRPADGRGDQGDRRGSGQGRPNRGPRRAA